MIRFGSALLFAAVLGLLSLPAAPQTKTKTFKPVTQKMLENPSPDDWLMFSRTYDAQRYSPLKQITKQNVNKLQIAWQREMETGTTETIPIVHDGVMYVAAA